MTTHYSPKHVPAPERISAAEALERWYSFYINESGRDVSVDTQDKHRMIIDDHLIPRWGDRWADSISDSDVIELRDDLAQRGYQVGSARSVLVTAGMAFRWLQARGLAHVDPTNGISPRDPSAVLHRFAHFTRPVTISETAAIAAQLPAGDRAKVWIQRLAGLRVAEVHGLKIGNIRFDHAYLQVRGQGGRNWKVRESNNEIRTVTYRSAPKTDAGRRDVPLCDALVHIIIEHIETFRSEASEDEFLFSDGDPGNRCTQYNERLKRAALDLRVTDEDGMAATTHVLRKSFSTDLGYSPVLGILRSRVMGHAVKAFDGGAEVTAERYTLTATQQQLRSIADIMDELVLDAGVKPSVHENIEPKSSTAISHAEACAVLGLPDSQQVSLLVSQGRLDSATGPKTQGRRRNFVTTASVLAFRAERVRITTSESLQKQYDLTPAQFHRIKRLLGLETSASEHHGQIHALTDEQADAFHAYLSDKRATLAECIDLTGAAQELGLRPYAIPTLIAAGELEERTPIAGVAPGPRRWVTKASVEQFAERYGIGDVRPGNRGSSTQVTPASMVSYAQAAEELGVAKTGRIAQLVHDGKLATRRIPKLRRSFVTRESLDQLLSERAQRGLVNEVRLPAGWITLRTASTILRVTLTEFRRNHLTWGITVRQELVNGSTIEVTNADISSNESTRELVERWRSTPTQSAGRYRPSGGYLTVDEVALRDGVAPSTARLRIDHGVYPGTVTVDARGRKWRFVPSDSQADPSRCRRRNTSAGLEEGK